MMRHLAKHLKRITLFLILSISLTSCSKSQKIITGITEREANIIVVFLEARGIHSNKVRVTGGSTTAAEQIAKFDITVVLHGIAEGAIAAAACSTVGVRSSTCDQLES